MVLSALICLSAESVCADVTFSSLESSVMNYDGSEKAESELRTLLKQGANPNEVNKRGQPVIFRAILPDTLKALKVLLEYKADINARDKNGFTPLMRATFAAALRPGEIEPVKFLLANGADVNVTEKSGMSALHLAAKNMKLQADTSLVEILLKAGANVNQLMGLPYGKPTVGFSPLALAATTGNNAVIKILIAAGANPNLKGAKGMSPLESARFHKHEETVRLLESFGAK